MSLQETAAADRVHIGFFGKRNAGKSSLVNAVTGQSLSVVSDVRGTTTDPVKKAMELLPVITEILTRWETQLTQEITQQEKAILLSVLQRMKQSASWWEEEN